ncbi:MAG: hypothetical protein U5J63_07795 [Fodinibius sp.]|nr:hypothetical protein [Fodinibius sp.]
MTFIEKRIWKGSIIGPTLLLLMLVLWSCTQKTDKSDPKQQEAVTAAPLFEGMGNHHFDVSLDNAEAVRYFDQAIMLTYGFNHKEAERSYRQVAEFAPNHPMAWWGIALVQGPNLNLPMLPEAVPVAWEALQKAQKLKANGTQRERDYIDALAKRYVQDPPEDRSALDSAYAEAMGQLAEKYPDDLDAQVLYAEAMMDQHPWDFWTKGGEAKPWTPRILDVLESVIAQNPDHPMANHLYIHATEASPNPENALSSAERLGNAVPGAGHLVHMPAHTYIRVGMYHEATLANERAVESDNEYVAQCHQQGMYPLGYIPHNHHFLWATASLEGREKLSLKAANATYDRVDTQMMREPGMGLLQHYWTIPMYANVRFGQWDEMLAYPEPKLLYPRGVWHYSRGMAYVAINQPSRAMTELEKLNVIAANDSLKEVIVMNHAFDLMQIATRVLEGEIAAKQNQPDKAIALLREAITIEDNLLYNEPPDWFFPVRHNLGAVLLANNKPIEAEQVYRDDLREFPKNGWALFGLHQSLMAQGRDAEAQDVKAQFDEAWKYADIELTSSRILGEEKRVLGQLID